MDIPILGQPKGPDIQNMHIRLLMCTDCKSMDEIPDFEGHPDDDTLLKVAVEKHRWPSGTEHKGNLFRVPLKFWANPKVKDATIKQIVAGVSGGIDDIEAGFYDAKSNFQQDAMACFNKHLRPAGRCPSWRDKSKELVPNTAAERKDAGMAKPGATGPKRFLCDFCPAALFMHKQMRALKGQYK